MASEYCPRCRTARDTRVEVTRRTVTGPGGAVRGVRTRVVHCAACSQFIRSEDLEEPRATVA